MDGDGGVISAAVEALWLALQVAGRRSRRCWRSGLVVSVLQALTQVQEATLAFLPKLVAMALVLLLSGPAIGGAMRAYADALLEPDRRRGRDALMLEELPALAFGAVLVAARVGGAVMLLPGLGEPEVPPTVRLSLLLALVALLLPALAPALPAAARRRCRNWRGWWRRKR